ncbi:FAM91A1-like protein [Trifolium pratense]|uniref:FAM91A1-like protein n=1 Tax=Trifolium pratense TaxID=57577 RepID=A0A2K3NNC4_TRIPR|nr:FAM91A1-like protein [Trifolium pratense]
MKRAPVTTEELLLEKAIKEECQWENLPRRLHPTVPTKEEWTARIIEYCVKKRLQWNSCFASKFCKESEYYDNMMRYLRKNLALFPYHLADYVCRVMRVSPFRYYCDMIFEVMKNEQPYDSIPNFSAADALRLTGIGRNEFIDIMNKCRSKHFLIPCYLLGFFWFSQPVSSPLDCLIWFGGQFWHQVVPAPSRSQLRGIESRSSLPSPAPITTRPTNDRYLLGFYSIVSRLEGFVSNREQSYEDPIEELLYAVFVVSNENATVRELATTLQAELSQLQAAASFVCRLGWATKVIDPETILGNSSIPPMSPRSTVSDEDASVTSQGSENMFIDNDSTQQGDVSASGNCGPRSAFTRVAFIVDANITSYLMMGSVSPGLKTHAVTLYEAGKLGHASIADLCRDLSTLESTTFEGELQEFANHAYSLRCVLECLHSGGIPAEKKEEVDIDKMGTTTSSNDKSSSVIAEPETSLSDRSRNSSDSEAVINAGGLENVESEKNVVEEAPVYSELIPSSTGDEVPSITSEDDSNHNHIQQVDESDTNFHTNDKLVEVEGSDVGTEMEKKKKYRVDILRSESLASLAPATLNRLFLRDYDILVSIVPHSHSSILPRPTGPVHFGPPTYSSMSPWMKLVLYSTAASGPLSVVLMKGQCMRLLPAPLAGCEKAMIWSWDSTTIGGLGRKFEGSLVNGSILLHCLNSLLKHSAVLVLPLNKDDLNKSEKAATLDIPLPLKNADGTIASVGEELGLCNEENANLDSLLTNLADKMDLQTVGYIRLLRLYVGKESGQLSSEVKYEWVPLSLEFGIPLFSPTLCSNICRRIVSSEMLQSGSFVEHHDAMQSLRKKLYDICAEYQSTGFTAKLLYQKKQAKESFGKIKNHSSGRWSPLIDPSCPISGASSVYQRLKLANRQCGQTEVLSFDGSVLRSYALSAGDVAATAAVKEATQADTMKTEAEENDSKEAILPGVNLIFDGSKLLPFDIGACLQASQPISLITEAAAISASVAMK